MALINCKECGREMSTNADSCPNCGNKNDKYYENIWNWFWWGLGAWYLEAWCGFPVEFSFILATSCFIGPALLGINEKDFFINATSFTRFILLYFSLLSLISVILFLIIWMSATITNIFIDEEVYVYDWLYGYEEILLGLYLLLPLLGSSLLFFDNISSFFDYISRFGKFLLFGVLIFCLQMVFFLSWYAYGFEYSNWIQLLNLDTKLALYIFGAAISLPVIFAFLCMSAIDKIRADEAYYKRDYRLGIGLNLLKVISVLPISTIVVEELSYTLVFGEVLTSFYSEQYFVYVLIEIALGILIALCLYYPLVSFAIAQCKKIELEVLTIIAYKQPITWEEIKETRNGRPYILEYLDGILCYRMALNLKARNWADYVYKDNPDDDVWTTTKQFLDDFGLESISDLHELKPLSRLISDKNLLIQNIIKLSGKPSWKSELEHLDIAALNDIHEKLSRGTKE